jgi:two-component system KDP operon response regulator KdpE
MFFRRKKEPVPRLVLGAPKLINALGTGERPKKILIVDDDPVILKGLSLTLKSKGYEVVTATDGGEAINQVREEQPDMLLVDVSLPIDMVGCGALGWDGFQIARWVRHLSCKAPAIMMSVTNKPEYREQAIAAGARGFLPKPISNEFLLASIDLVFSEKRKTDCN